MTRGALPLAVEDGPSACRIADANRGGGVESGANEGDDGGEFPWLKREGRHPARGAARDHLREILVGLRAPELAAAKVNARDLVAVPPVTLIALGAVEDGAPGDVLLCVLAWMILGEQLCTGRRCQQEDCDESQQPRAIGHLATLYTRFTALSTFTGHCSVRL